MDYATQYQEYLARVNRALETACDAFLPEESEVCRAARYSLLGGGKRIRAVLVLAVCDMLNGDAAAAEQFAAAVEMLHCYSLIHDDLPCMDNDDLRRGKPSCHKAFGEATAMLAGDVLLTEAFEVIANVEAPAIVNVRAAKALGAGAGSRGMVYGQELDLKYEALAATEEQLRLIHRNKTGALINAAVQMGAAAAQANETQCKELEAYAFGIGLVFQIVDDVLDVTGSQEQLGKPIGSDSENGKTTFVTLYGTDGAMELAQKLNDRTCASLRAEFGEESAFLEQLAKELLVRRSLERRKRADNAFNSRGFVPKSDPDGFAPELARGTGAEDPHQLNPAGQIPAGTDVGRRWNAQRPQCDRLRHGHCHSPERGHQLGYFCRGCRRCHHHDARCHGCPPRDRRTGQGSE